MPKGVSKEMWLEDGEEAIMKNSAYTKGISMVDPEEAVHA
jgi:hypothetical protein